MGRVFEAGDIASRAATENVSNDEALRRFRFEHAFAVLQAQAATRWPSTFAGGWIDVAQFGGRLAFTDNAVANVTQLRGGFAFPDELYPVNAATSYAGLRALEDAVIAERNALQAGGAVSGLPPSIAATRGAYDVSIDVIGGTVEVRAEPGEANLARAFQDRYGPSVTVSSTGVAHASSCTITDCRYAMMGGLELYMYNSTTNRVCSSAFTATNGSNRFTISAGHCQVVDFVASHRFQGAPPGGGAQTTDRKYGGSYSNVYTGSVDAERIIRNASVGSDPRWRESSKIFMVGENPRNIDNYIARPYITIGAYIGKTGRTTGTTRGYVTRLNTAPGYIPNSTATFIEADYCNRRGDSGGGVLQNHTAWGIHSGAYFNKTCRIDSGTSVAGGYADGGTAIFGVLQDALSSLGLSLLTNTFLPPTVDFTSSNCSRTSGGCYFVNSAADQDGVVVSYSWAFGDGTTSTAPNPQHSYALPGTYTVSLQVTDNDGKTATISHSVTYT